MSLLKRLEQDGGDKDDNTGSGSSSSKLSSLQARRGSASPSNDRNQYLDLKTRVQNQLLAEIDPSMDISRVSDVRKTIQELYEQILMEESIILSRPEKHRLFEQIVAEIIGLGPLQPLLEDPDITEIMVNGSKNIYVEKKGKIQRVPITFENEDHVMRII
ncbi:MAG: CpaF family protein, partial [Candidatus Heimdallarchaeota archaeon]|nr:CpaF family protein [Candidatus Heimdallarchaeota archaeon]